MPLFATRFFVRKSVVMVFCRRASPMYFSFRRIFRRVDASQKLLPAAVLIPSAVSPSPMS